MDTPAQEYSEVEFVVVDSEFAPDHPNVSRAVVDVSSATYLMGVAAATTSKSGSIGFIGGVQGEMFNSWLSGYEAGARATNDSIAISASWLSGRFDQATFQNPEGAHDAAMYLYEQGVDVIFTAAGESRLGALRAASDFSTVTGNHVWAIGVDVDEGFLTDSNLQPYMLTSMIKRLDRVVFDVINRFLEGTLEREKVYGTADGVAGYSAFGDHIDGMKADLDATLTDLESAQIIVPRATALPSTWVEPAPNTFIVTFDGNSCAISNAHDVYDSEVVSFTFVNTTDRYASIAFAMGRADVTDEMYEEKAAELDHRFWALIEHGSEPLISWTVPPGERYEVRTTFDGTPCGVGLVQCWVADSEGEVSVSSFKVLDP